MYDISNPWWIVTMASLILLSPLFHGTFISLASSYQRRQPLSIQEAIRHTVSRYSSLVVGELLVNLLVTAALFLFILPGIYLGLRLSFYKQALVLDRASAADSLRASLSQTTGWQIPLAILLLLSPFYGLAIAATFAAAELPWGITGDVVVLATSTLTFAWTNTLLTKLYISRPREAATTSS